MQFSPVIFRFLGSRDSSADTVTGYEMESGVRFLGQVRDFSLSTASRSALGPTQPPTLGVQGAISPGVKRPGHEAQHSPLPSTEVKNGVAIPPPPICLHGAVLN
jgi:hypothetical protein